MQGADNLSDPEPQRLGGGLGSVRKPPRRRVFEGEESQEEGETTEDMLHEESDHIPERERTTSTEAGEIHLVIMKCVLIFVVVCK